LQASLPPDATERDAKYFLDALRTQFGVIGPIGVVGHCLSGASALRMAAACPSDIAAAISLHGGKLFTAAGDSPHRLLSRIRAQLYFGHADADATMPLEAIEGLEASLAQWGGEWKSELYQGARHGWTITGSPAYDPVASERAFLTVVDILQSSTLPVD
jgi:carboxymethylenebutenolidase